MKIIVASSEKDFDQKAAAIMAKKIIEKPDAVLGFATGNTTIGFHRELAALTQSLGLDWSCIRTVNLDEFLGAARNHPMGVYARMFEQLLSHTNIKLENVHIPDSDLSSAEETCQSFPRIVKEMGGVDLQVLGIGGNAHIAMNDPGTPWEQDMLVTPISPLMIRDKAHLWGGEEKMPKRGITMGMRLIMQAKTQLLMAKGASKAQAIHQALYGPISCAVPASALQLHPDFIVLLDEGAASLL